MTTEQKSTNNLCQLPKYIKFRIFAELNLLDLSSISGTSKSFYQACQQDDFWSFKVRTEFPEFERLKSDYLTYRQWYWRLQNSGDLYTTTSGMDRDYNNVDIANPPIYCSQRYKSYPRSGSGLFYITIFDELYFTGRPHHLPDNELLTNNITCEDTFIEPTKLMDNILNIHFLEDASLCLTTTGNMVVYLNYVKGIPIQPSKIDGQFKNIFGGTTNECLCLTRNDELYLVELVDRAPVLSKISDNVKTASHGITDTNELIAYYVTKTGELWNYYPYHKHKVQSISKLGLPGIHPPPNTVYENVRLVQHDVKSANMLYNYLLIVDTQDELWIYGKTNFYTDPIFDLKNDDEDEDIGNYDQIDHEYSGQYDNLAGWNQDRYHNLKLKMIKSSHLFDNVCLLDTSGNLYYIWISQLIDIKLNPILTHVISCFNDGHVTVISRRGVNPVILKPTPIID